MMMAATMRITNPNDGMVRQAMDCTPMTITVWIPMTLMTNKASVAT